MKKKLIPFIMIVLLAAILLTACSSKASSDSYSYELPQAPAAGGFALTAPEAEMNMSMDSAYENIAMSDNGKAVDSPTSSLVAEGLKIIYTAYADVQTKTFQESYDKLLAMLQENNGYVQNADISGGYTTESGYYHNRYANLTLRVPAENYKRFLEVAGTIGTVTNLSEHTEDITAAYIDVEARLTTLKAQEKRLLELLSSAEVVADLIEIESKLAEVRYQIESFQSQMNTFEKLLAYSTITIYLQEVPDIALPKDTFGQKIIAAFSGSGEAISNFLKGAVIVIIYLLPFLVLGFLVFLLIRFFVKKGKKKRDEKRVRHLSVRSEAIGALPPNPYVIQPAPGTTTNALSENPMDDNSTDGK